MQGIDFLDELCQKTDLRSIRPVGIRKCIAANTVRKVRAQIGRRIKKLVILVLCQGHRLINNFIKSEAVIRISCVEKFY